MAKNNSYGGCCGNGRNPMAKLAVFGGLGVIAPVASFTVSPDPATGDAPLTVAFTDTSTNTPTSWSWAVVGGTVNVDYVYTVGSATSQNPTIRFDTPGTYTVTLTATNAAGSDASDPETITANYLAEALAFFAVLPVQPSASMKDKYNDLIISLKAGSNNWSKLDRLWIRATELQGSAVYSIVNPSSTAGTEVNSPTWTQYQGYTGNGTNMSIDDNWAPFSGVNYQLNNACAFVYIRTNINEAKAAMGAIGGGTGGNDQVTLFPRSSNNVNFAINSNSLTGSLSNTDGRGLLSLVRTNNTQERVYRNGAEISGSPISKASTSRTATEIRTLARSNAGTPQDFTTNQVAINGFGAGSINQSELYASLQAFMTALGTQV